VINLPRCLTWLLLLATLCALSGCSRGEPVARTSSAVETGADPGGSHRERVRFDLLYGQWRSIVGELAALDIRYHTTSPRRRAELRSRYDELVAQGTVLQDEVLQAALIAYAKAPQENADLGEFLTGSVFMLVSNEEYEEGLRIVQLLLDGGVSSTDLSILAGSAAFATGEFDLAARHWRQAKEARQLFGADEQHLKDIDDYRTGWDREQQLRAAELAADDLPRVLLTTTQGEIELELFENEAPKTVANFVYLVEQGFYDGLTFYRVVSQVLAEAGCPNGDGTGGPGYVLRGENQAPHRRQHFRGSLAMIHSGPDVIGSRFYITFVPARHLDRNNTVFGRVVRGIDVLAKLQRRTPPDTFTLKVNPRSNMVEIPADKIVTARVLRKRDHPYQPPTVRTFQSAGQQRPYGS